MRGPLDFESARRAIDQVLEQCPDLPRLWDFRDADLGPLRPVELRAISEYARTHESAGIEVRVAALAPSDLEFGVSRMYEAIAEGTDRERHGAFRDESEALAWLLDGANPAGEDRG